MVSLALTFARMTAGQARFTRSTMFDGKDEEQMVVESEEKGAMSRNGKQGERKKKKRKRKENIKIF